jgi:putative methyltransferase (TIGR04325 family)
MLAPIALFVYNRPWHTLQTLGALKNNVLAKDSILYIFADGAKPNATEADLKNIADIKLIIKKEKWAKEVLIFEKNINIGLANSIISGVNFVLETHGNVIVLEDDILVSPFFLQYMNDGLQMYKEEKKVASIHAYNYPIENAQLSETFFVKGADCWGWATWKDRWNIFERDASKLMGELTRMNLINEFDIDGTYPYSKMLQDQIDGKLDSWAIRWYASAFLQNMFTLYPKKSLIYNIGIDNSGTHSGGTDIVNNRNWNSKALVKIEKINIITNNEFALYLWKNYFANSNKLIEIPIKKNKLKQLFNFRRIKKIFKKQNNQTNLQHNKILWEGSYENFEEAKVFCTGYEAENILDTVKLSTQKVIDGEAVYERDGYIFDELQHNWSLVAMLKTIAANCNNELNVIDFGGSLGSTFNYVNKVISSSIKITWNVIEQDNFFECGKALFETNSVKFYKTIDDCIDVNKKVNVLLLSSVLQYLPTAGAFIDNVNNLSIKYILIDRTSFTQFAEGFWTVQKVPEHIYTAMYPCYFFNFKKLVSLFLNYEVLYHFESAYDTPQVVNGNVCTWNGVLLTLKNN